VGEDALIDLLAMFEPSQFLRLRRKVHLNEVDLPPGSTPAQMAELFIKFIKQRDQGDLSALVKAT
jgi:hypothetical protein